MVDGSDYPIESGIEPFDGERKWWPRGRELKYFFFGLVVLVGLVTWQGFEHRRVRAAAREDLRNRAKDMTNSVGVVLRSQARFGFIPRDRLEAALRELAEAKEIKGIAVLNQHGEQTALAGEPVDLGAAELVTNGESWRQETVTFVNLIDLGTAWAEGEFGGAGPVIVQRTDQSFGGAGQGFPGRPGRSGWRGLLSDEANKTVKAMMDGHPLIEADVSAFVALIPGDRLDERRLRAIKELLTGESLKESNAMAAFEIAYAGESASREPAEGRRSRFRWELLSDESSRALDKMADGRVLDKDGVAQVLGLFNQDVLDDKLRTTMRTLLLGSPFDASTLRMTLAVASARLDRPSRRSPPFGRPPWLNQTEYEALQRTRGAHWFVLTLSDLGYRSQIIQDLRLRGIVLVAGLLTVLSAGLVWRTIERSSELKMRLVRARDLNLHLRETNLAAAGLVHETKNPLNIVRGLAQMMSQNDSAPESMRETAMQVTEEVDRVTNRLNQFLEYSRPPEVKLAPHNLNEIIEGVRRILESDRDDRGVSISLTGPSLAVEADQALLRQVIFNLLLNALQAVGSKGRIVIRTFETGHRLGGFEVCDDGPGVPADIRDEIFRPYFTASGKGSGLGLAIVRQMVLAHQWQIACTESPEWRTCFRVFGVRIVTPEYS